MKLSQTIVEIRKKNELTQEELAKEFNVTRQTVSNWENGKSYPDLFTLIDISDKFGCSLDSMLKEDTDMTEAMSKSIELGKKYQKDAKKSGVIWGLGALCCAALTVIYGMEKEWPIMIIWLFCTVANLFSVIRTVKSTSKKTNAKTDEEKYSKLSNEDLDMIKKLCSRGMNAEAVKLVRNVTGVGLMEAEVFVEEISK